MTSDDMNSSGVPQITFKGRNFLIAWGIGLTVLLVMMGWLTVRPQRQYRNDAVERHRARMAPDVQESGTTPADSNLPEDASPQIVHVGIYVDRISELSVKDASWTVDFYIWFRWTGDVVRPGDDFRVVDGWIESCEKEVARSADDLHYERYRVVAKITKPFDVSRFPRDEHLLTINVENPGYQRHELLFAPDEGNSSVSSRVKVSAYQIAASDLIEKPHSYRTTRGDPQLAPGATSDYSQARFGMSLTRTGWGYFFKMFQALYIAVAIAMLAMFIKPTNVDPRFGLGIGGLFAAVANSYATSSLIPDTGIVTLADMVNGLGVWMIMLTVVQSTISLHLFENLGAEMLSRRFDLVSFMILSVGYVVLNLALPLAANS